MKIEQVVCFVCEKELDKNSAIECGQLLPMKTYACKECYKRLPIED